MSDGRTTPASATPLEPHEEFEALAVGQAMHALEPEDEQRLAAHLVTCPSCARVVADAAALGAAMATTLPPASPSPGLRSRLVEAAAREPRSARAAGRAPASTPLVTDGPSRRVVLAQSGRHLQPAWRRPRVLALTAVLAAVLGAGIAVPATLSVTGSRGGDPTQTALAQALAAPGVRSVTMTGGGGATGHAVVSEKGLFLVVDGLPHNDARRSTYVLWTLTPSGERSALTTFDVTGKSSVVVARPGDQPLPEGTAFAVSYEKGRLAPAQPSDVMLTSNA